MVSDVMLYLERRKLEKIFLKKHTHQHQVSSRDVGPVLFLKALPAHLPFLIR